MLIAHDCGLAGDIVLERAQIGMALTNPDLMRINPLSKIPTLETDDGQVIFDSLAICLYLAERAGRASLIPDGGRDRADVLRRHALANGLCDLLILLLNERGRPAELRSTPHQTAFRSKIDATLDSFEAVPAAKVKGELGLQQATLGAALGFLDFRFPDIDWRASRSGLSHWYEGFCTHPAAAATAPENVGP